ncbi:MAG: hypothetical protein ACOY94_18425 [Bacillota bacterium]
MQPEMEQSLFVEFEELFALRDRLRSVADQVRAQLLAAGLRDRLEPEIFDNELELRGPEGSNLLVRLDSYRLEVAGVRPDVAIHRLAAIILAEAEVFRLTSVEIGFSAWYKVEKNRPLRLVAQGFPAVEGTDDEPMLDRRLSMTWEWGTSTTGYSFHAMDTEDKELLLSFKAREGYMTLPELHSGAWVGEQALRFEQLVHRFLTQLGWTS